MKEQIIVVDARMINSSGIGTYLKNLLPLIYKKYKLVLLGNSNELKDFSWTKDCKIIDFRTSIYSIKEQLKYPFIIPKTKLFWSPHFNTPILPVKADNIITTIHDVNHLALKHDNNFLKSLYAKLLYRNAVKKSKNLITVSDFSESEIIKHLNVKKEKITRIYCGINSNFSSDNTYELPLKTSEKYILYVGNVKPHKNLITLIKAFKRLPKAIKEEYKLLIIGKKEGFITSDKVVESYINEHKLQESIKFTGYISDKEVLETYKKASLFVFPSLYEGFGLPVLEAMSCGVPVISSNAASLKEVGGNAPLYFNAKNYEELSDKIQKVLSNNSLKNNLIEKGLEQIKSFSWQDAANKHIAIFNEVFNEK